MFSTGNHVALQTNNSQLSPCVDGACDDQATDIIGLVCPVAEAVDGSEDLFSKRGRPSPPTTMFSGATRTGKKKGIRKGCPLLNGNLRIVPPKATANLTLTLCIQIQGKKLPMSMAIDPQDTATLTLLISAEMLGKLTQLQEHKRGKEWSGETSKLPYRTAKTARR